jgi:hypothetical protein
MDLSRPRHPSEQTVKQRHRLFQIESIEPLNEPTVDRRKEVTGFSAPALGAAEPGKTRSNTQFPELWPPARPEGSNATWPCECARSLELRFSLRMPKMVPAALQPTL